MDERVLPFNLGSGIGTRLLSSGHLISREDVKQLSEGRALVTSASVPEGPHCGSSDQAGMSVHPHEGIEEVGRSVCQLPWEDTLEPCW